MNIYDEEQIMGILTLLVMVGLIACEIKYLFW